MAKTTTSKHTILVNLVGEKGIELSSYIAQALAIGSKEGVDTISKAYTEVFKNLQKTINDFLINPDFKKNNITSAINKDIKKIKEITQNVNFYDNKQFEQDKKRVEELKKEIKELESTPKRNPKTIFNEAYKNQDSLLADKRSKTLQNMQKTLERLQATKKFDFLEGLDLTKLAHFENAFKVLQKTAKQSGTSSWTKDLVELYHDLEIRQGRVAVLQQNEKDVYTNKAKALRLEQNELEKNIHLYEKQGEELLEYKRILQVIVILLQNLIKPGGNAIADDFVANLKPETLDKVIQLEDELREKTERSSIVNERSGQTVKNLVDHYLSLGFVIGLASRAMREMFTTIKEIDSALNEITVVSTYTTKEVWEMYDSFLAIANATGTASSQIIKVAGEYFKQGKTLTESLKLTEAAAMSARVAGISAEDSVRYLTAALNGYGLAAEDALMVSDKFSKLAAKSATDYDDMAIAMSKVAAQASSMGVGMDNLMGMMTTALEVTQEAPENIGTSFKTILARMAEIKDLGIVKEDATTATTVSKALSSIGVALFDVNGQMRNLDEVLLEVGNKWSGLDNNTKRYLTTVLAGTRQQTRLMAVFENWGKTLEFIEASEESEGSTIAQNAKTYDTVAYSLEKLNNAYEEFIVSLGSNQLLKDLIDTLTGLIRFASSDAGKIAIGMAALSVITYNLEEIGKTASHAKDSMQLFFNVIRQNVTSVFQFFKEFSNGSKTLGQTISLLKQIKTISPELKNILPESIFTKKGESTDNIIAVLNKHSSELVKDGSLTKIGQEIQKLGFVINIETKEVTASAAAWTLKNAAMTMGISLAITTVIGLVGWLIKEHKTVEELNEEVTKLYSTYHNTKNAINDVEDLVKEYETLRQKIIRTNEELERMEGLQAQINEKVGGNAFNGNGEIDYGMVNGWTKKQLDEQIQTAKDAYKDIKKMGTLSKAYFSDDAGTATFAKQIMLAQTLTGEYKDINKAIEEYHYNLTKYTKEEINLAEKQVKVNAILGKTVTKVTKIQLSKPKTNAPRQDNALSHNMQPAGTTTSGLQGELTTIVSVEKALKEAYKNAATSSWEEAMQEIARGEFGNFDLSTIVNTLGTDNLNVLYDLFNAAGKELYSAFLQNGIVAWEEGMEALEAKTQEYLQNFNESFLLSLNEDIINMGVGDKADELFDALTSAMVEFKNGSNDALLSMARDAEQYNLTLDEMYNLINENIDALLNIPSIDDALESARITVSQVQTLNDAISNHEVTFEQLHNMMREQSAETRQIIINDLATTGQISEQTAAIMQQAAINTYHTTLETKQGEIKAEIAALKSRLTSAKTALEAIKAGNYQEYLNAVATYNNQVESYVQSLNQKLDATREFEEKKKAIEEGGGAGGIDANKYKIDILSLYEFTKDRTGAIKELENLIGSLEAQLNDKEAALSAIEALKQLGKEAYDMGQAFGSSNGNSAASGVQKAEKALKEYERKLDEVTRATEKLQAITNKLDLVNSLKELYNDRNGAAYNKVLEEEEKLLNSQIKAYEELIKAQKKKQSDLVKDYSKEVTEAFEIVDGRLIPIMDKYNKLSSEQAEAADKFFESFNQLTDEINKNTGAMIQNQAAIKELAEYKRDQTIKLQEILINAIKNEQKALYEAQKEALEKQKEYLEKRKQMYQDAFSAEDYEDEIADLEKQRENLQQQIAGLAGATDANSKKKKVELEQQLSDVIKDINDKTLEHNRDALLDSIDEEMDVNEQQQTELEELYNKRIEDYKWLQEQIDMITKDGWDKIKEYLKEWDDDYKNSTDLMKERTEEEWKFLYETSNYYLKDTAEDAKEHFEFISNTLKTETDKMVGYWNSVKEAADRALAAKQAANNAPVSRPSSGGGGSSSKKTHYLLNGGDYGSLREALDSVHGDVRRGYVRNYQYKVSGTPQKPGPIPSDIELFKYMGGTTSFYRNGGYVDYTGLAMVHGNPSSPEAFLSAKDTKNFEVLKSVLEKAISTNTISNSSSDIVIEELNIETQELNNDQDWYKAGTQVGRALKQAMHERGIVTNLKK